MRVFVYEHLCACPDDHPEAASLRAEGWAMLRAVLEDCARCPGVQTVTLLAPSFRAPGLPDRVTAYPTPPGRAEEAFRSLARDSSCLVVAPEFDDLLYRRCAWAEEEKGR